MFLFGVFAVRRSDGGWSGAPGEADQELERSRDISSRSTGLATAAGGGGGGADTAVVMIFKFLNGFEIKQRDVTRFSVEEYRGVFFCSVNQKFNFIKNSILFLSFCFLLSVHCCQRMLLNLLLLYTTITIYIVTSPVPTGFVRTQLHSGVFSIGDWSTTLPDNINPFSIQGTKRNGRLIL